MKNTRLFVLLVATAATAGNIWYWNTREQQILTAIYAPLDSEDNVIIDCRPGDATAYYPNAYYVFSGIVKQVDADRLIVEPTKIWKGSINEKVISIRYKGKRHEEARQRNEEYVFFLTDKSRTPYSISYCDFISPQSGELVKTLDSLSGAH